MSKRGGKAGRNKWIISEWVDLDSDETWLTIIAVVGWVLLMVVSLKWD